MGEVENFEMEPAVMGKSQIKSQCQISNHSVNRFKSFNQISNLKSHFFLQISNLLVTNLKSNLKSLIFAVDTSLFTDFSQRQKRNLYTASQ